MATTVDWDQTNIIFVPRVDMTIVQTTPYEIREYDIDTGHRDLRTLEADALGGPYQKTHDHFTPVTVGGITDARKFIILNPYTLEFESGNYGVNIIGGNSNIRDVLVRNNVSVNTFNSTGAIEVAAAESAEDIADAVWDEQADEHLLAGSTGVKQTNTDISSDRAATQRLI